MPGRATFTRILRGYDEQGGGARPSRAASGGGGAAQSVEDLVEDFGRPLLTVAEAARRLNVSNSAVRTLCRRGLLPYGRVLNFIRLRPEDVERFVVDRQAKERRRG